MTRHADMDQKTEPARADQATFQRMLVVIDDSASARGATEIVAEWIERQGAEVRIVQLTDDGERNRQLVRRVAESALAFEADVIVLGVDRRRLAGHRLTPSLRELLTRATELPVLVAPERPEVAEERGHALRRHAHV